MKVLYVGGTGQISFDCVHETVRAGHETWVFNRGNNNAGLPDDVSFLRGDFDDDDDYGCVADGGFDVICQFRVFTPEQIRRDLERLAGRTSQYIFISSASAYQKPVPHYVITEDTPLENPYAQYSRDKAACEAALCPQDGLPYTIVRPSHTTRNRFATAMGEAELAAQRLLRGKPVVVPGDGTSLWTLTAACDFAPPFVRLFGKRAALGEAFHLTSNNTYTWDRIYTAMAAALGVEVKLVHVPSDTLVRYRPAWLGGLLGDKSHSVTFDNAKIKGVVGDFRCDTSLDDLMATLVARFRASGGDRAPVDAGLDALFDRIVAEQSALGAGP
jgi:nucleoside-diphosphate-sugar epimerase